MLETDDPNTPSDTGPAAQGGSPPRKATTPRKRAAKKTATKAQATKQPTKQATKQQAPQALAETTPETTPEAPARAAPSRRRSTRKATAPVGADLGDAASADSTRIGAAGTDSAGTAPAATAAKARKRARKVSAETPSTEPGTAAPTSSAPPALAAPSVLFVAPTVGPDTPSTRRRTTKRTAVEPDPAGKDLASVEDAEDRVADPDDIREAAVEEASGARRRRRRGRRGRGGANRPQPADDSAAPSEAPPDDAEASDSSLDATQDTDAADADADTTDASTATHRRRRRRRASAADDGDDTVTDDSPNTVVHVREPRAPRDSDDGVRGVKGSTRLEAKRQRRRDGHEGRRRPPILSEAEFLARRESVERVMAVRQSGERTQIAVLEDGVLVEHHVTRASATSYVGNVYLGRVQNVLPSMEAAFVDIGKGRNGVLYAGEVNWDAAGLEGKSRTIEDALKSGDTVLVQVTKDPIGHKGARLTSQVSLPGRFLVYVPGSAMTGISRKLPDTERHRLKAILKKIVPEDAGVIVRTAAEGASEAELTRDVERLRSEWERISKQAAKPSSAPSLVHGEPDLAIRVVRDVFNEDFGKLIVQGDDAWTTVSDYVEGVAPDLAERVSRHLGDTDLFHDLRVDEQLAKALDRKVWLPSGGSLVIDRTEAMTVIDVNTGKFVGTGGNLEQTVTRNNLEAAEEIVRQLRLRDVGGIIVIDFIDMVLESNRELVLRRLTECLGRDGTKHQVSEVTSLGLVQMTRKRVGEGLLEAFSEPCTVCNGRGLIIHSEPVERPSGGSAELDDEDRPRRKRQSGNSRKRPEPSAEEIAAAEEQRRIALAAMTAVHRAAHLEEGADDDDLVDLPERLAYSAAADDAEADTEVDAEVDAEIDAEIDAKIDARADTDIDAGADAEEALHHAELPDSDGVPLAGPGQSLGSDAQQTRPARRRRGASRPAGPPSVAAAGV